MIDVTDPPVPAELTIEGSADRRGSTLRAPTFDALLAAATIPPADSAPAAAIAHLVVAEARASEDYARAERAARLAYELLPDDEATVLDLAGVLDAGGQVADAYDVLRSFASERPGSVSNKKG